MVVIFRWKVKGQVAFALGFSTQIVFSGKLRGFIFSYIFCTKKKGLADYNNKYSTSAFQLYFGSSGGYQQGLVK